MSLIRLNDGQKFEIDQPQESEGMMRGRKRRTVKLTFRAAQEQFEAIRAAFTAQNLAAFCIYYPDNETAGEPDEQLEGVAHKAFDGYSRIGEWTDREIETQAETSETPAAYARQLSVTLGEQLLSDV